MPLSKAMLSYNNFTLYNEGSQAMHIGFRYSTYKLDNDRLEHYIDLEPITAQENLDLQLISIYPQHPRPSPRPSMTLSNNHAASGISTNDKRKRKAPVMYPIQCLSSKSDLQCGLKKPAATRRHVSASPDGTVTTFIPLLRNHHHHHQDAK